MRRCAAAQLVGVDVLLARNVAEAQRELGLLHFVEKLGSLQGHSQ
jgi:hypothetical protein